MILPARHVMILGAGASAGAGAPLMRNFFDEAERRHYGAPVGLRADFRAVLSLVHRLGIAMAKVQVDVDSLEGVFSAVDMACLVGRIPGIEDQRPEDLRRALIAVIAETIESSMRFESTAVTEGFRLRLPVAAGYQGIAKAIANGGATGTTFISFNYDLGMESAIHCQQIEHAVDYGLEDPPTGRHVRLYKLHGSLSWTSCPAAGGRVLATPLGHFLRPASASCVIRMRDLTGGWSCPGCGQPSHGPMLVPPSWDKSGGQHGLATVWAAAARALADAEAITILGFSLPDADLFFRYLLAVAFQSATRLKRVWIIDPGGEQVHRRFHTLAGPRLRGRILHDPRTFSAAEYDVSRAVSTGLHPDSETLHEFLSERSHTTQLSLLDRNRWLPPLNGWSI